MDNETCTAIMPYVSLGITAVSLFGAGYLTRMLIEKLRKKPSSLEEEISLDLDKSIDGLISNPKTIKEPEENYRKSRTDFYRKKDLKNSHDSGIA